MGILSNCEWIAGKHAKNPVSLLSIKKPKTPKERHCKEIEWTVRWIENWLNGRAQRVVISSTESSWKPIVSGAPKRSVLDLLTHRGPFQPLIFCESVIHHQ